MLPQLLPHLSSLFAIRTADSFGNMMVSRRGDEERNGWLPIVRQPRIAYHCLVSWLVGRYALLGLAGRDGAGHRGRSDLSAGSTAVAKELARTVGNKRSHHSADTAAPLYRRRGRVIFDRDVDHLDQRRCA